MFIFLLIPYFTGAILSKKNYQKWKIGEKRYTGIKRYINVISQHILYQRYVQHVWYVNVWKTFKKIKNDAYQSLKFSSSAQVPWVSKCPSTWVPWVLKSIQSIQMWHNFESFSVWINTFVRNAVLMIYLFVIARQKLFINGEYWYI